MIEATEAAATAWTDHVQQVASHTLLPEGRVLVHGRQHPRQAPAVPAVRRRRRPLPATAATQVAADGYEGFALSGTSLAGSAASGQDARGDIVALDQATAALLEQLMASGDRPLHEMTPQEARGVMAALRGDAAPGPDMAEVRDIRVRVSGGLVPVRVLTPAVAPRGVIVYYHGGGWVLGGLDDFDAARPAARAAYRHAWWSCADYRLAPEYRFPTAVDDSWAALRLGRRSIAAELAGGPACR